MKLLRIARNALFLALLTTRQFAMGANAGSDGGRIALAWEKESLEFKPTPGTSEIRGVFKYTNPSRDPITISRMTPSCGCLKVVHPPQEIGAGESGTIEFTYDAKGKEGVQTGRIEVQYNGAAKPSQTLRLRIELTPLVSIRPGLVIWEKSAQSKDVAITVNAPGLTLDPKVATTGNFTNTLSPSETKGQFLLRIERPTQVGRAEGWATLTFSDGSNKPLERKIRLIAD